MSSLVTTIKISTALKEQLDHIAVAVNRPDSWVVEHALERYVATEMWQIAEIRKAIAEADRGNFATEGEVEEAFSRWR